MSFNQTALRASAAAWLRRFARRARLRDRSGSVNIIFGLSVIPLVGLLGLGVDYGVAEVVKTKLDNAADSAAVAAVATAKAYIAANPTDSNLTTDAVNAGLDRAGRAFAINAGTLPFATVPSQTAGTLQIALTRSADGATFTSSVSYTTLTQNHFGTMFRNPTMTEAGTATATASVPLYLDFYLLVDVSGSMGLPASDADQATLANLNGGCQFACHFPPNPPTVPNIGFQIAATAKIQLRSDSVNQAVCGLLAKANQPYVANQYRVGIYPFITQMATLAPLSATITNVATLLGCNLSNLNAVPSTFTNLLDTGSTQYPSLSQYPVAYAGRGVPAFDPSTGTGSGGTHFENIFSAMQSVVSNGAGFGTGAASNNSKPYVFLITDGMQNSQYYGSDQQGLCNGSFLSVCWNFPGNPSQYPYFNAANFTTSSPQAMDPSKCAALKNAGATISVLYIPYINLTLPPPNSIEYQETLQSNNARPNLPNALTLCAGTSAGNDGAQWIHTANTSSDINTALGQMFQQALQAAHLTQ